eukprot:1338621-Prorocentrum_lima.AAC.1
MCIRDRLFAELAHGRLAMLVFIDMFSQDGHTRSSCMDCLAGAPVAAGDFGFKDLASSDPANTGNKLSADLAYSRLAMTAIMCMVFPAGLTGSAWSAPSPCSNMLVGPRRVQT